MTSYWLVPFALLSEFGGALALVAAPDSVHSLVLYLISHTLACLALTLVLMVFLPERYRSEKTRPALFLFSLQFAIPLIGSLGVFAGILLALYLPRSQREIPWQEIDIPELPYEPINLDNHVAYTEGGLRQILREAGDPDKRLKALLATRQMSGRNSVEILREALTDPVDDVRLLAYSMLEQKEKGLVVEAGRLQERLKQDLEARQQEQLTRRLAQVWWEMAYLGLAQGSLRRYYLENAQRLLVQLVGTYDRHNDWRLLGRVELALGNTATARDAFEIAIENGAPADYVLPYLAEIAYLERDFQRVRYYLARCAHGRAHPALAPLLEAWL